MKRVPKIQWRPKKRVPKYPTPLPGARQPERGALDAIVAHQAPGVRYYLISNHPERAMCGRCHVPKKKKNI